MPRVTCRCGERINVRPNGPERVGCPKCGAKIRLRHSTPARAVAGTDDGYVRFLCPCGRRLKVSAVDQPVAGKCPDCGRVVPVPLSARGSSPLSPGRRVSQSDPEARTEELDSDDLAQLETWAARYTAGSGNAESRGSSTTSLHVAAVRDESNTDAGSVTPAMPPASVVKFEAGLRICPRCRKPVHLGAATCRECGTPVPRR
jgi:hypothetical protein